MSLARCASLDAGSLNPCDAVRLPYAFPTVDGIDPDSCQNVDIHDCYISTGGEPQARAENCAKSLLCRGPILCRELPAPAPLLFPLYFVRSTTITLTTPQSSRRLHCHQVGQGRGRAGRRHPHEQRHRVFVQAARPFLPRKTVGAHWITTSRRAQIRNMVFGRGHGISIGSEMSGNVTNIFFHNLTVRRQSQRRGARVWQPEFGSPGLAACLAARVCQAWFASTVCQARFASTVCQARFAKHGLPSTVCQARFAKRGLPARFASTPRHGLLLLPRHSPCCLADAQLDGTERGVRIKSQAGRGGQVANITYSNMTLSNVEEAISISMFYGPGEGVVPIFKVCGGPLSLDSACAPK